MTSGSIHTIEGVQPSLGDEPLHWATYLVTRFLQGLFNHMEVGSYRWEPNPKDSEIYITEQVPVDGSVVAQRPAIAVVRGPAQWANLTMDQMVTIEPLTGKRVHSDLLSGNLGVYALSAEGLEAQRIAWLCSRGIKEGKRLLQKYWIWRDDDGTPRATFGFNKIGDNMNFGSESDPGSIIRGAGGHELVMVALGVPYFLQWTWQVTPTSPAHREDLGLILDKDRARDVEKPPFHNARKVTAVLRDEDDEEIQEISLGHSSE